MELFVMVKLIAAGMLKSVGIFCWTLALSIPLGVIVALLRRSKSLIIRTIVRIYISVMRGTPLMLQLFAIYFGPYYIFNMRLSEDYCFLSIIIGFTLNYAAYFAEIFRSGIESTPVGQYEACNVLGYNKIQTFGKIILPQVIKRVLPPVTNETITLVKDTSLAFVLSYIEMFTVAKQIAAKETSFIPFLIAGLFYFVFNFVIAGIMSYFEKKLNYYK